MNVPDQQTFRLAQFWNSWWFFNIFSLPSMPFISLLPFFTKWKDDPVQLWLKDHQPRLLNK